MYLSWTKLLRSTYQELACLGSSAVSPCYCRNFINKAPEFWNCRVERWVENFLFSVDAALSAQAGGGLLASPNIAECVIEWDPLRGRVCLLKLRLQE